MASIDVLVATYNGEKFLEAQLDSLIFQSFSDINIIISDDCSSDATRDIINRYAREDSRISAYFCEKNIGLVANFEFLLSKVTSPYFAFCDQDDFWYKKKLEICYNKVSSGDFALVFSDLTITDELLNEKGRLLHKNINFHSKLKKYDDFRLQYISNCVIGCTMLAKSELIPKILPIPKGTFIIHDYYAALVASLVGKIGYIDIPLIFYRQHSNNVVGTKVAKFNNASEKISDFKRKKIEQFSLYCSINYLFPEKIAKQNELFLQALKGKMKISLINKVYKYESFYIKLKAIFLLRFDSLLRYIFKLLRM